MKNILHLELSVAVYFVLISILQNCALMLAINSLKVDRIFKIVLKDGDKSKSLRVRHQFIRILRILTNFKTQISNKDLSFGAIHK